jgi:hypothetical protein
LEPYFFQLWKSKPSFDFKNSIWNTAQKILATTRTVDTGYKVMVLANKYEKPTDFHWEIARSNKSEFFLPIQILNHVSETPCELRINLHENSLFGYMYGCMARSYKSSESEGNIIMMGIRDESYTFYRGVFVSEQESNNGVFIASMHWPTYTSIVDVHFYTERRKLSVMQFNDPNGIILGELYRPRVETNGLGDETFVMDRYRIWESYMHATTSE